MKKSAIALMGLACTLAVSSAAFAATITDVNSGNSDFHEVKGQYHTDGAASTVYSVDVAWDSMKFTYTVASEGTWNPTTHRYDSASEGQWSGDGDVKVTNHSNAKVKVAVTYAAESSYSDITGRFSNGSFRLATAEGTQVDSAPNQTATLTLSGELDKSVGTSTKLGTATVTITAAQ
ncbi:hypothetical protein H9X86_10315 [Pseudoflavonifractor capillosus]|uniref:hypothetical protein n=1 Tax=Pseudoflavonifractor capillosus TaxID=106588 RepID=UPI001956A80E|nr:hypothetical protein [Pseudoflavonifractor capillosus]MBM6897747.1 hypothetical protein [Pseudoflavonifractor capillosus]